MAPAAPFNPPAADLPGKQVVPEWIPPPVTKETHDFAQLTSIDLSLLDSDDPAVVDELISQVKRAIREDGFLFLENYGVSLEQVRVTSYYSRVLVADVFCLYFSCTVSLLLRSTYTTTLVKKIRTGFFSTLTRANGPGTNIHMDSR